MDDRIFSLGDEMARTMPTPQEHAIQAEDTDAANNDSPAAASGLVDRHGRPFDPSMHRTDDVGNPILTDNGLLRVRRGRSPSYVGTGGAGNDARRAGADSTAAGQAIADAIIGVCHMALGDEWAPKIDPASGMNERLALGMAWGRYFEATGMRDIPPGWALGIVMTSYALPRFAQPQTQTRVAKIGAWTKAKLGPLAMRWRNRRGRHENRDIQAVQ